MPYLFRGSLMGLRWQMVASSITAFEAGPSRLLTASRTLFCDLIRSCICDVRRNCRPHASRNLQEAIFDIFFTLVCAIFLGGGGISSWFTCLPWRVSAPVVCSCTSTRSSHVTQDRHRLNTEWPFGWRPATREHSALPWGNDEIPELPAWLNPYSKNWSLCSPVSIRWHPVVLFWVYSMKQLMKHSDIVKLMKKKQFWLCISALWCSAEQAANSGGHLLPLSHIWSYSAAAAASPMDRKKHTRI